MKNLVKKLDFSLLAAVLLVLVGIYSLTQLWSHYRFNQSHPKELTGILLPSPKPIKPFNLLDHHGLPFTEQQLKGEWSLIFFGYTHCPDVCPTSLSMLAEMVEYLEKSPQENRPLKVLFISVDPKRDTPAVLKDYVPYFNEDFLGITGLENQLKQFAKKLKASYRISSKEGEGEEESYDITHTSAFFLFNPKGQFTALFQSQYHTPEKMAKTFLQISQLGN